MTISSKDWNNYISRLSSLSKTAAEQMTAYVNTHGLGDRDAIIRYAYALATKYGEGSAELACEMYDAMAEISGVTIAPAEPAATATYGETAKAINGSLLQSPSGQLIDSVVDRLVKQAASDTTLKNAKRDGAQWAWIPAGDTCAFCLTLASRGWQSASKAQMKGDHATHIHAHCDCQFQIRFDSSTNVEGYDPDALLEQYYAAEGNSSKDRINSLRRMNYDGPKVRAQKREAYAKRTQVILSNEYTGLLDEIAGNSVGSKFQNYDILDLKTGGRYNLVEGSRLQDKEVFAGKGSKKKYNKAQMFADKYGGNAEDWQHVKARAQIDTLNELSEESREAEVHWSQCEGIGKHEMFIKKWLDD